MGWRKSPTMPRPYLKYLANIHKHHKQRHSNKLADVFMGLNQPYPSSTVIIQLVTFIYELYRNLLLLSRLLQDFHNGSFNLSFLNSNHYMGPIVLISLIFWNSYFFGLLIDFHILLATPIYFFRLSPCT